MSCLIIKNDGIGDLIIASGIISELSKYLNEPIDLVTCKNNREVAESIPGIRNIFYVSRDNLRYNRLGGKIGLYFFPKVCSEDGAVLNEIRVSKYNTAICLRRFIRASSLFIMKAVRANHKVCMWQFPTNVSFEIAHQLSEGWVHQTGRTEIRHELNYYRSVLETVFGKAFEGIPRSIFLDSYVQRSGHRTVGISIGGPGGNWPVWHWIKLIRLLEHHGWKVSIFGGKDAVRNGWIIEKCCDGVSNYVGKVSFAQSVPLLSSLRAFIGNETGFTHFVSLFVPKVLIIYGGRTFKRFFPWPGSTNQYVIYHAMECFDCNNKCHFLAHKYRCLLSVRPKDVVDYFFEIMEGRAPNFKNLNPETVRYRSIDGNTIFVEDGELTGT